MSRAQSSDKFALHGAAMKDGRAQSLPVEACVQEPQLWVGTCKELEGVRLPRSSKCRDPVIQKTEV